MVTALTSGIFSFARLYQLANEFYPNGKNIISLFYSF